MEKRNKSAYKSIVQYLKSIKEIKSKKNMFLEGNKDLMDDAVIKEKKKISKKLNEFKIYNGDFLSTIPSMNEYDNIGEHIRFLEENININQEKIKDISNLIEQLNSSFYNP